MPDRYKNKIGVYELKVFSLWILSIIYGITMYFDSRNTDLYKTYTIITMVFVFVGLYLCTKSAYKHHMVFVLMFLVYYFFTQFGMCMVHYLIDPNIEYQFSTLGATYLRDQVYLKSLTMALIGFTSTIIGAVVIPKREIVSLSSDSDDNAQDDLMSIIGLVFLIISAIYFTYYIATGQISFGMDYSLYRSSGAIDGIYEWIIVFYMIGACFVYSCANDRRLKLGIALFAYTAIILMAFGNRGEVLYPLLACFGIYIIKKKKIPVKLIIVALSILFFLIPFVKVFRHIGTMSLQDVFDTMNPWGGVAEMGVSFRMTSYIITELESGTRELLYGFSYYNPIINMLDHLVPWSIRLTPPDSFNFTNDFYAMKSMTTVAESYANFGSIGVILHHIVTGYFMASLESKDTSRTRLALTSSVGSVFIYSVRSRIASVPIEIAVCFFIYFTVKILSTKIEHRNMVKA